MLKAKLEKLLEEIKSECNQQNGGEPYSSVESNAWADGKQDLAEDILFLIQQADK